MAERKTNITNCAPGRENSNTGRKTGENHLQISRRAKSSSEGEEKQLFPRVFSAAN